MPGRARPSTPPVARPPAKAAGGFPDVPVVAGLAVVVAALIGVHTLNSIYHDIGRHIAVGELIRASHAIPRTNHYSFTFPDYPFVNHHWLGSLLISLGHNAVGFKGLIITKAVLLAAGVALALLAVRPKHPSAIPVLAVVVAVTIMTERTDVRPEILSYVYLGWFLFVLHGRQRLLWTLPLVQLVWVNTHIYFFFGPMLWVAWLAGAMARDGWKAALSRRNVMITALMVAATLCNPRFVTGAFYPLRVFGDYGYTVAENQTLFFMWRIGYGKVTSIAVIVGAVLAMAGFAINWRRWRENVFGAISCAVTCVLAFLLIRNFPVFALAMIPATIQNFDEAGVALRWARFPGLALLAALGVSVISGQFYRVAKMDKHFGLEVPQAYDKPIDYFRTAGFKGPIFNNFDIGSFLIWKLPEERVFVDGRPEAYPANFFRDVYIPMQSDPAVWARESARYKLNAIIWNINDLTPWSQAFVTRITADPDWTLMYFGEGVLILLKNTEENLPIIMRHPPVIHER